MGINKKEYEKTIPVFQKQEFQRELNTFMMFKEKSDKLVRTPQKKKP